MPRKNRRQRSASGKQTEQQQPTTTTSQHPLATDCKHVPLIPIRQQQSNEPAYPLPTELLQVVQRRMGKCKSGEDVTTFSHAILSLANYASSLASRPEPFLPRWSYDQHNKKDIYILEDVMIRAAVSFSTDPVHSQPRRLIQAILSAAVDRFSYSWLDMIAVYDEVFATRYGVIPRDCMHFFGLPYSREVSQCCDYGLFFFYFLSLTYTLSCSPENL